MRPLMYREQGQAVDEVARQPNPEVFERIIEIGRVDSLLATGEALAQGESLALMTCTWNVSMRILRQPPHWRNRPGFRRPVSPLLP